MALDMVKWPTPCSGRFTPENETWYPFTGGSVGPRVSLEGCG